MNATARALHVARCRDPFCEFCPAAAESHAADLDPDYSTDGAADQWERGQGL